MALKIGIQTWGHEGDVRPFLALASGLTQAGHAVRLAYSAPDGRDYASSLTDAGYEHTRLVPPQSPSELHRIGEEIFSLSPLRQGPRIARELLTPLIDAMAESAGELASWADVLVLHPMAYPLAAAAEARGKPFVCVYTAPVTTRAFPPLGLPHLGVFNLLAWKLLRTVLSAHCLPSMNQVRARFGLAPVKRFHEQLHRSAIDLIAMSPTLLSRPDDWSAKVHLLGFFDPPSRYEKLDPELKEFLKEGPAPVYVTFGTSEFERDPRTLVEMVEEALAAAGCRAIVQSDLPVSSSPTVLRVNEVARALVLPRCSAIVHHGGAILSQAALSAGRPSVVVAHVMDQFAWGRRLHKLGVAPPHLDRAELDPRQLQRAIESAVHDRTMRAQAERLGELLRQEDGVRRAVELISRQGPR